MLKFKNISQLYWNSTKSFLSSTSTLRNYHTTCYPTTNDQHKSSFKLKPRKTLEEAVPSNTKIIRGAAEKIRAKNVKEMKPMSEEEVTQHFNWYQKLFLTKETKKEVTELYKTAIESNYKSYHDYPEPKSDFLKRVGAKNPKFYVFHSRIFTSIVDVSADFKKQNLYNRLDMLDPDIHFEHTELFVRALHLWFIFRRSCFIPDTNEYIQRLSLHFWAEIEAKMVEKGFPENNLSSLQKDLNSYVHGFFEGLNLCLASESDNDALLSEIIWRHFYQGRVDIHMGHVAWWIAYIRAQQVFLDEIPDLHFLNGNFEFLDPSKIPGAPIPVLPKHTPLKKHKK